VAEITNAQRAILRDLIDVARAALQAADASEDAGDAGWIGVDRASFDELSNALDVLEELPDDQPDVTISGPARAEWALRDLLEGIGERPWLHGPAGVRASDKGVTGEGA
jgi:hypothetical protein